MTRDYSRNAPARCPAYQMIGGCPASFHSSLSRCLFRDRLGRDHFALSDTEELVIMSNKRPTYPVQVAGLQRNLPLFEVAPGVRIAVLNILGDTELVQACALALSDKLSFVPFDVIVTAEAKSIPL